MKDAVGMNSSKKTTKKQGLATVARRELYRRVDVDVLQGQDNRRWIDPLFSLSSRGIERERASLYPG